MPENLSTSEVKRATCDACDKPRTCASLGVEDGAPLLCTECLEDAASRFRLLAQGIRLAERMEREETERRAADA